MLRLRQDRCRLSSRQLREMRNDRKMGKRGVGGEAPHSFRIPAGLPRQVRHERGGCCGAIWRLYSAGQPCLNLRSSRGRIAQLSFVLTGT